MCFMMDPTSGKKVCYVQFPQRFDGIDNRDRYSNRNVVFFDVSNFFSCSGYIYFSARRAENDFGNFDRSTWRVWMVCKGPYMLAQGVSSEGKLFMDMMLLSRRSHRARLVTAGRSGAVCAVDLEKTREKNWREKNWRKKRRRHWSKKRHLNRYMHLKPSKKVLKVTFLFLENNIRILVTWSSRYYPLCPTARPLTWAWGTKISSETKWIQLNCATYLSITDTKNENQSIVFQEKLEKKFGQSPVFVASTLLENGGIPKEVSSTLLLKEAIHVISCGYEDKTEWGKEVSNSVLNSELH